MSERRRSVGIRALSLCAAALLLAVSAPAFEETDVAPAAAAQAAAPQEPPWTFHRTVDLDQANGEDVIESVGDQSSIKLAGRIGKLNVQITWRKSDNSDPDPEMHEGGVIGEASFRRVE